MSTSKNFTITNTNNEIINFQTARLTATQQFNVITKLIQILAKGSGCNSKVVEQLFNNYAQTGVEVDLNNDEKTKITDTTKTVGLFVDAIRNGIANLQDDEKDWLLKTLLKNTFIVIDGGGLLPCTNDNLDMRFDNFKQMIVLYKELVAFNFGFFGGANQ